ncbi:MAG TPA: hypothetical protein VFY05_12810 [Candidatus Angelobacter sp.]|nr:hypothetical protein [Candidatus Angelobacter sp.]
MAEGIAPITVKLTGISITVVLTGAFKLVAVGASFWQQPCDTGMTIFPHSLRICLQQARSAGVRCALGSAQAIVGASNGSITAMTRTNWRNAFT